jgi:hypothetical protein
MHAGLTRPPSYCVIGKLIRVCGSGVFAMVVRIKKIHPALKHAGYAATALLPGEDPAAFEKLHQDLIAELHPDGPLENATVAAIARLTWRKQNLDTFRIAQSARDRYSAIRSKKVPSTIPPQRFFPLLDLYGNPDPDPDWEPPDPAEVKAAEEAAEAQARKELGDRYPNWEKQQLFLKCSKTWGSKNVWTP